MRAITLLALACIGLGSCSGSDYDEAPPAADVADAAATAAADAAASYADAAASVPAAAAPAMGLEADAAALANNPDAGQDAARYADR